MEIALFNLLKFKRYLYFRAYLATSELKMRVHDLPSKQKDHHEKRNARTVTLDWKDKNWQIPYVCLGHLGTQINAKLSLLG